MFRKTLLAALGAMALAGCASSIDVTSDHYGEVNFSSYQTFDFVPEKLLIVASAEPFNPLLEDRLKSAAAEALIAKGYRRAANPDDADFLLSFFLGARDQVRTNSYPDPYRKSWRWEQSPGSADVRTYTEGALSIDIFEVKTRKPVWQGTAIRTLSRADRGDENVVKTVVDAILEQFPPE